MKRIITSIVILLASFWSSQGQTMITNACESSPCNAITICGIGLVNQLNSFTSTGNPQGTCGASFFTNNWVYYRFNCYGSGNLIFTITPNDPLADMNWALWDITSTGCGSLSNTTNCSAAASAGAVTSTSMPITNGSTYILGIQRASGGTSTFGFTINFTGTTATLNDAVPPSLASVVPFNICQPVTQIKVKLTEAVRCSQISANDFTVSTNPTFTVAGASCPGCVNPTTPLTNYTNYEDTVTLNFATALAPGTYTVSFNSASTNLPRDYCNTLPNTVPTLTFTVPVALDLTNSTGYNCVAQTYIDTLQGSFGATPYQYKVKGGTQLNTYGATTNSYNVFTGLQGGVTYTLFVKDANGCEDSNVVTHTAFIPLQAPNLSASASPPCYNQFAIDSIVSGPMSSGQGPYTFSIASVPAAAATSGTFYPPNKWKNLQFTAGASFTVTVTDSWGCTKTAVKNLINPAQLVLPTPSSQNPLCPGDSNGTISVTATGGTGPWNYVYNPFYPPTMNTSNSSSSHIGNLATNVPAGIYTITVTDMNGCTTTVSRTLTTPLNINQAATIVTNPTCLNPCGGKIKPLATGGTGTKKNFYLYDVWPGAPIDSVKYIGITTVTDSFFNGTVTQPSGLCAGTYTVMAVDQAGCTATVTYTLSLPLIPVLTWDSTINASCFGGCSGKIYTTTTIASSPLTYSISPTTIGACTATSIGANTGDYQNLAAGSYTIIVTKTYGADQCKDTLSNILVTEPPLLTVSVDDITDVSCNGGNDGEIEVLANGGTAPITFTITPLGPQSNTNGEFQNLTAQCYTITATDANGCTATTTACVIQPTVLTLTVNNIVNVSCFGFCDGTAQATAGGATPNYTYTISAPGVIDPNTGAISALCVGTYTVTVTDDNTCTKTATFSVTEPSVLSATANVTANVSCNGDCNGTATITPAGGTTPYSYTIVGLGAPVITAVGNTGSASALCAGVYTVTVTDAHFCSVTVTFNITQPAVLTAVSALTNNPTCANACNGVATATPSGGTSPYNYTVSGPGSPSINASGAVGTATNLCNGTYTIQVTDAHFCTTSTTITITDPPLVTIDTISVQNALCHNSCDGVITMTAGGGIGGFSYAISPTSNGTCSINQAGNVFNNAWAATYVVTVQDANACTATMNVTVTDPALLVIDTTSVSAATCNGACDGSIQMTFTGGTAPVSYTISPNVPCAATQATPGNFGNLGANLYMITGTDAHGCTATKIVLISQPSAPTVSITPGNTPTCSPGCDGTAQATGAGGVGGFTYSILPNSASIDPSTGAITNVCAGISYTVTASDGNTCSTTASFLMITPGGPTTSITSYTLPTCNPGCDGAMTVVISGGTGPYTYSMNSGTVSITGPTMTTTVTGSNLCAGTNYILTVTDANLCVNTADTLLNVPAPPTVSVSGAIGNVTCFAGCNGTATVTSSGGTGLVTFGNLVWQNAMTCVPTQTVSGTFTNLGANTYTVTGTDASGCTGTVSFTVTEPSQVSISVTSTQNVDCNGNCTGIINFNAAGGTPVYGYSINPNTNGTCNATLVGSSYTTLWSGSYVVTVSDGNGCTASTSATITQPNLFTIDTLAVTHVSCNGGCDGTISLNYSGGSGVPTYGISPNVPCAATQTTPGNFGNLGSNLYTVIGTDGNGCTASTNVLINQPSIVTLSITPGTLPGCNPGCDGTAQANPGGGTPGYTYIITGTANISSTGAITNVCANVVYTVTAQDSKNCTATATFSMNTANGPSLTVTNGNSPGCNPGCDGTAQANPSGGAGGYTYGISGSASISSTGAITNACASVVYTVTTTDANGCTATATFSLTTAASPTLTVTPGANAGCNPGCDGTAQANPNGGAGGYTYGISGTASISSTGAITNACANINYVVTVTDANGCTATATFSISTTPSPTVTLTGGTSPSCTPGCDGTAQANPNGGTPGYTYQISGSATISSTGAISGICAGTTYTVTLTDSKGCTATSVITMTTPNGPVMSITSATQPSCSPGCDGVMNVSVSGGTGPYTYAINSSAGLTLVGPTMTTINAGNLLCDNISYTLTVTDANQCVGFADTLLLQPTGPTADTISTTPISCYQGCNGSVVVTSSGGANPISYTLTPVNASSCPNPVQAGTTFNGLGQNDYIVKATDGNGCIGTFQFTMTEPTLLTTDTFSTTNVSCFGNCNGQIVMVSLGGTSPYVYSINPASAGGCNAVVLGNTISGLAAGTYTVMSTDAHLCTATKVVTITQPAAFSVSTQTTTNVSCNGVCDGTATMNFAGGTAPVSYSILPAGGACPPQQLTTGNFSGLAAGTYTVQGLDTHGCTNTVSFTITQPTVLSGTITPGVIPSCGAGCNGTAQVNANGGTPGYTYQIAGSASVVVNALGAINGVCSGITYTVTITDSHLCTAQVTFTMTTPGAPTISVTNTTTPTCQPGCDGTASVAVVGGTTPLTYSVNNSATMTPAGPTANLTATANNLCASTNYIITVTDANACTGTTTVNLLPPTAPVIDTLVTTPVSCTPGCDGSITMTPAGLTYTVTPAAGISVVGNVISNLCSGTTYTIIGTNVSNCKDTFSYTPAAPLGTPFSVSSTTNPSCNPGCDGTATMSNAALTYTVSPSGPTAAGNIISGICANTVYTIVGTDANNCTNSATVQLFAPGAPTVSIVTLTNPTSFGGTNGSIQVGPIIAGATYTINPLGPQANATGLFTNLTAQTYTITVTTAQGCTATVVDSLQDPGQLICTLNSSSNVSCFGGNNGAFDVNATGGVGTLTYSSTTAPGIDPNTGIATGLTVGTYTVIVTDQNLVTCSQVINITQPTQLGFGLPTIASGTCTNPCSGSINIAATGGTPAYTYAIQSPAGGCTASQANPNAGNFTNIGTGTYTIVVTDLNNCTASISVIIAPPVNPTINSVGTTNVTCNAACNGQIIVNATGATIYSINNGANYQPSNTFNAVCAGTYTVVVQSANGCTASSVVTITEPPVLLITNVTTTPLACAGTNTGTITITASGGAGGYQYSTDCTIYQASNTFNNLASGTYTLCVKDANNCTQTIAATITAPPALTWVFTLASDVSCFGLSDGSISVQAQGGTGALQYQLNANAPGAASNFTNLIAGTYTVTCIDANNCLISTTLVVAQPPALAFTSMVTTNNLCFGTSAGTISVTASGGTPYSSGYVFTINPNPAGSLQPTPGYFTQLPANTYVVTVFDSTGCSLTYPTNIVVTQPPQIVIAVQQQINIECYGAATGLIDINATGGTNVFTYQLMPGNLTNNSGLFNNLTAGTYTLYAIDQNNCTASILVSLTQPPPIQVATVIPTEPVCHGDANGALNIIAQGGQPPYQYSLDGGPLQPTGIFTGLVAKTYLITIVDSKGCQHQENYVLTEPDFVGATLNIRDAKCIDSKDGRIVITGTGGRGGYSYSIMPGLLFNKSGIFTNLEPGLYHLTVKDTAGCMYLVDFTINPPANPLGVTITKKDLGCTGKGFEGQATANVFGGEQPYTYLWMTNPIQTEAIADSLYYGWYQLQVTDGYGCVVKDSVYIEEGPCCDVSFIPNAFSPNGDGNNDVFRILTTAGVELQQLEVYDRWGKRVWSTNNYRFGWDGTIDGKGAEVGTYYYVFRYKCTRDQQNYVKKGDLILIR